ncbi:MAG: outer membrane protein assembly factor BamD, partial [Bryobacteraceae bacterium]
MIVPSWVPTIPVPWPKIFGIPRTAGALARAETPVSAILLLLVALTATAQPLATLGQTYRKTPTDANRAALTRFAANHPKDAEGAQALLVTGATDVERKSYDDALQALKALDKRLPTLADYAAYLRASVQFESKNYPQTVHELDTVLRHTPQSPLTARAILMLARTNIEMQKPKESLDLIRKHYAALPAAQADLLLGKSSEAMGDPVAAATQYQNVYYLYPSTPEAAQAATSLDALKQSLGDKFPAPAAQIELTRAGRLLNSGEAKKAKAELEALVPRIGGAERDLAQVRIGVADYYVKDNQSAYRYLQSLTVSSPEPDAERLYYVHAAARRLKNDDGASSALDRLNKQYPASQWRLQALQSEAYKYLVT